VPRRRRIAANGLFHPIFHGLTPNAIYFGRGITGIPSDHWERRNLLLIDAGRIAREQAEDCAASKAVPVEEAERESAPNLEHEPE